METELKFDALMFSQQDESVMSSSERYRGDRYDVDMNAIRVNEIDSFRCDENDDFIQRFVNKEVENGLNLPENVVQLWNLEASNVTDVNLINEILEEYNILTTKKSHVEPELNMLDDLVSFFNESFENTSNSIYNENDIISNSSLTVEDQIQGELIPLVNNSVNEESKLVTLNKSYFQKQLKSYLQVMEPRCSTGHELYQTPPSSLSDPNTLLTYPKASATAFNMGNLSRIKHLVSTYFNHNCLMRVIKPNYTEERVGSDFIIALLSALLESFPDAVNTIRSSKYCKSKSGTRLIKVKYTFSGTQISSTALDDFKGSKVVEDSIVNDMDRANLTEEQLEGFRRREQALKAEGKLMCIESDIVLKLYIDNFTGKIGMYEANCKAASFKACE